MPIPVNCSCGASYTLKDEYAGQVVRCPKCSAELRVGTAVTPPVAQGDAAFDREKFLFRQKHLAISEKYYVDDEQGNAILFVERPARMGRTLLALLATVVAVFIWAFLWFFMFFALGQGGGGPQSELGKTILFLGAIFSFFVVLIGVYVLFEPKRHVTFYRDDTKREKLLEVFQDRKWQIPTATYTVRNPAGQVLARLRKNYFYNLFRKRWYCDDSFGRSLVVAKEDSIILSLLRRVLGTFFGLLRTNFIFLRGDDVIGEFNRKFTILDRYLLDLSADPRRSLNRRVAVALGVMLDTGERR